MLQSFQKNVHFEEGKKKILFSKAEQVLIFYLEKEVESLNSDGFTEHVQSKINNNFDDHFVIVIL